MTNGKRANIWARTEVVDFSLQLEQVADESGPVAIFDHSVIVGSSQFGHLYIGFVSLKSITRLNEEYVLLFNGCAGE